MQLKRLVRKLREVGTGNINGGERSLCCESDHHESLLAVCHLQRKAETLTPIIAPLQQKEDLGRAQRL